MSVLSARADARHLPLRDESVHLVVTSPPYNAGVSYDEWDDSLPWEMFWRGLIDPALRECFRVLVPGGRIAVNFANVVRCDVPQAGRRGRRTQYQSRRSPAARLASPVKESWVLIVIPRLWALLEEIGFLPREHLTWVKGDDPANIPTRSNAWGTFRSARNPVLRATSEPVLIASKGSHSREPGESDLTADEFKSWTRNAWFITTGHRDQYLSHPAKFPLELPRRLIKLYSYVGDVVLDPFGGSGTTVRAARDTGRHGISIDLSKRYSRLAAGRASQATLTEAAS